MEPIIIKKGRTESLQVLLGHDVSTDTFFSQIRVNKDPESELIATWTCGFVTDGTDGALLLTLDNSVTSAITKSKGYMDIKRVTGGEPVDAFEGYLEVLIQDVVTA